MRYRDFFNIGLLAFWLIALILVLQSGQAQRDRDTGAQRIIPKTWDDEAMTTLELPLADPRGSPKHISADFYYRMPERPIYKSYPVYAPGREPGGYFESLKRQEPVLIWGTVRGTRAAPPLVTELDWRKAGKIVFDAPIVYDIGNTIEEVRDPGWYQTTGTPLTRGGVMPFYRYVVREKGKVELGTFSCATCHTRVMPDGTALKGAQGNFGVDRALTYFYRRLSKPGIVHGYERAMFAAPWLRPDPNAQLDQMSVDAIADAHQRIPPGVLARHRSSLFFPPHVPDLIGVKDRHYLDASGLQQHRSIADLMRYAALNQAADDFASFNGFMPMQLYNEIFFGKPHTASLEPTDFDRYSDEQLYALALYLYSLQPPPNPNKFDVLASRGQKIFEREGCAMCHTPPLYTNNQLTPAEGFKIPADHPNKYEILPIAVGTDPNLAMKTRRGTGYYKVPSLKGVWYRSMFEHNGSCATLEDWFNPQRLRDDYVPTGFKGYGVNTRAVKGHLFGLDLSDKDKTALITFLKTL